MKIKERYLETLGEFNLIRRD